MSSGTVTFQPHGVVIPNIVFTDFGALSTYITSQPGVTTWTIFVDGTFADTRGSPSIQTSLIPYPLPLNVTFSALPDSAVASGYPTLSGDDVAFQGANAVSFVNFPFITFNNTSVGPVFTVTGPSTLNAVLDNTTILNGFTPFFNVVSGGNLSVILRNFAVLGSEPAPSQVVVAIDATSVAFVSAFDAGTLVGGAVSIATGGTLGIFFVDSAMIDPSYATLAGASLTLLSMANEVAYSPAVPGNWHPPPTQVAQALDELAAAGSSSGSGTQIAILIAQVSALQAATDSLQAQLTSLQKCLCRSCERRS
jgi:hypothetical protein